MSIVDIGPPFRARSFLCFNAAFGRCALVWSDRGLSKVMLPDADDPTLEGTLAGHGAIAREPPPVARRAVEMLVAYFDGREPDFSSVDLDPTGVPPFNWRVYRQLAAVSYGGTTTYGTLATAVGEPGAARAVGRAMATNPWPIIVPCHRVLAAGERMGGFSAPGSIGTKARLHALEGIVRNGQPELPGL